MRIEKLERELDLCKKELELNQEFTFLQSSGGSIKRGSPDKSTSRGGRVSPEKSNSDKKKNAKKWFFFNVIFNFLMIIVSKLNHYFVKYFRFCFLIVGYLSPGINKIWNGYHMATLFRGSWPGLYWVSSLCKI